MIEGAYIDLDLYSADGWLDIDGIAEQGAILNVIVGARRIGKTYGVLKRYLERQERILYLRTTKTQLDLAASGDNSPWLPLNNDLGIDSIFEKDGEVYRCSRVIARDEYGKPTEFGDTIAQGASVFATRGIASGLYKAIFYDEFIPENGSIERKASGYNLKSTIQTVTSISRNVVPIWLCANSNNLDNDILAEFGLIPIFEQMAIDGAECWKSKDGTTLCINAYKSPVADALAETPLGRILNTGTYGAMAFGNKWSNNNFANVRKLSGAQMREYSDILVIGDICIMGHKTLPSYYVRTCRKPPAKVPIEEITPDLPNKISRRYPILAAGAFDGTIQYQSFEVKRKYNQYIMGGKYKL